MKWVLNFLKNFYKISVGSSGFCYLSFPWHDMCVQLHPANSMGLQVPINALPL